MRNHSQEFVILPLNHRSLWQPVAALVQQPLMILFLHTCYTSNARYPKNLLRKCPEKNKQWSRFTLMCGTQASKWISTTGCYFRDTFRVSFRGTEHYRIRLKVARVLATHNKNATDPEIFAGSFSNTAWQHCIHFGGTEIPSRRK